MREVEIPRLKQLIWKQTNFKFSNASHPNPEFRRDQAQLHEEFLHSELKKRKNCKNGFCIFDFIDFVICGVIFRLRLRLRNFENCNFYYFLIFVSSFWTYSIRCSSVWNLVFRKSSKKNIFRIPNIIVNFSTDNPECFALFRHRAEAIFIQLKNPVKCKENIFNHSCTAFLE